MACEAARAAREVLRSSASSWYKYPSATARKGSNQRRIRRVAIFLLVASKVRLGTGNLSRSASGIGLDDADACADVRNADREVGRVLTPAKL
jgi:hypothetical protein